MKKFIYNNTTKKEREAIVAFLEQVENHLTYYKENMLVVNFMVIFMLSLAINVWLFLYIYALSL